MATDICSELVRPAAAGAGSRAAAAGQGAAGVHAAMGAGRPETAGRRPAELRQQQQQQQRRWRRPSIGRAAEGPGRGDGGGLPAGRGRGRLVRLVGAGGAVQARGGQAGRRALHDGAAAAERDRRA